MRVLPESSKLDPSRQRQSDLGSEDKRSYFWGVSQLPQLKAQVAQIRDAIARDGGCVVRRDELRVLSDDVSESTRFDHVADIAQQEGWSFAFLKDGSVRFTKP